MSTFSNMISYLRKREGLSQAELADKLGVAKSTISMYERDERKPSFEMLEIIADYFNINMDTLVGGERPPHRRRYPLRLRFLLYRRKQQHQCRIVYLFR